MALFGSRKKREEDRKAPACCCNGDCCSAENTEKVSECCGEKVNGISSVKVLGAGCKSCHEQYENAQKAVHAMGLPVEVEYITDMPKVMEYGVMSMPVVVVNEKVAAQGKVLKPKDVEKLFRNILGE